MKKLLLTSCALVFSGCALFSPIYDARTVSNIKDLEKAYIEDIKDCAAGKLTATNYKLTIGMFESVIYREEAKK